MSASCFRSGSASRAAAALGALALLSACVSAPPGGPGGSQPLFKSQVGEISGGVAPGPHAHWYVQRQPVSFVKIGVASWRRSAPPRPRSWLDRLLGRNRPPAAGAEATAVVAAGFGLPVPSRVQVTNLVTGATANVRIDSTSPMSGSVIRLSAATASALGADPARPLLVRVRYMAPVVAYSARPSLRYALRGPVRAPILQARATAPAPAPIAAATTGPAPAAIVRVAAFHSDGPPVARDVATRLRPERSAPKPLAPPLRIQVGAYASLANAQRAADRLRPEGAAVISPLRRGQITLYRVVLTAPGGPGEAARLRARAAQIGFVDARLVGPL